MVTINKQIQQAINKMKERRCAVIEHKGFTIVINDNNWPNQYNLSVQDESGSYIFESHNYYKNDVLLYKNIEMILEYLG